ncbi:Pol protein, partial [Phytophthora palmivora]
MSTADHPQTNVHLERVHRVKILCAVSMLRHLGPVCTQQCGTRINGVYPVLFEWVTTPPGAANLTGKHRGLHRKWPFSSQVSEIEPESLKRQLPSFIDNRLTLISREGELVLLDTKNLPLKVVSSVESNKLKHRFIGPFAVLARHGAAYTFDLPKSMATHSTFYVGRLKQYHDPLSLPSRTEEDQGENSPPRNEAELSRQPGLPVSESVNDTQTGTHASHTNGMT